MKKSLQLRIMAILILIAIAIVDAFSIFVPITAVIGIALILFRPKWLFTIITCRMVFTRKSL